jgi:hypothetical protein
MPDSAHLEKATVIAWLEPHHTSTGLAMCRQGQEIDEYNLFPGSAQIVTLQLPRNDVYTLNPSTLLIESSVVF